MRKHRKVLSMVITKHRQLDDIRKWLHFHCQDKTKAIRIRVRVSSAKPLRGLMDSSEMVERFYWFTKPVFEFQKTKVTIFEHHLPPVSP